MTATEERQSFVFISYASKNQAVADWVVNILEAKGLRCWIAHRDDRPGAEWDEVIPHKIGECSLFLLILSRVSDKSKAVKRELTIAYKADKRILPVRIQKFDPKRTIFYITSIHWLDIFDQPRDTDALALVEAVLHPPSEPEPERRQLQPDNWFQGWANRGAAIAAMGIIMLLLLQLFFYVTGTTLLDGAALWLVLAVCLVIAWGIEHVWQVIKHKRSRGHEKSL